MKIILVDGVPSLYRPETEADEKEMLTVLVRAVRERKIKVPKTHTQLIKSLMNLAGKNFDEALSIVRSDSTLQSLCSSMYAGEHPTYNPSEVNVDAEDELNPTALAHVRKQMKNIIPLKRSK